MKRLTVAALCLAALLTSCRDKQLDVRRTLLASTWNTLVERRVSLEQACSLSIREETEKLQAREPDWRRFYTEGLDQALTRCSGDLSLLDGQLMGMKIEFDAIDQVQSPPDPDPRRKVTFGEPASWSEASTLLDGLRAALKARD